MKGNQSTDRRLVYVFLAIAALLVLMRIPFVARYLLILAGLALVAIVLLGGYRWYTRQQARRAEQAFRRTREGRIREKIEECERLLARNASEMEDIRQNVEDLEEKLRLPDLAAKQREEGQELLGAFRSEWDLRRTKSLFFERCRDKLRALDQHFRLERELETKKDQLRRLQENNYEELAQFEEIKTELELNAYYLETIDDLSSRMIASTSVDDAKHLQLELEEMTRELDH